MLLEYILPRKNGIAVIKAIKNFIETKNKTSLIKIKEPTFIFLTAFSTF